MRLPIAADPKLARDADASRPLRSEKQNAACEALCRGVGRKRDKEKQTELVVLPRP